MDFFRRGEHPSEVIDGENGVFFVKKNDGKSTGDALVVFGSDANATAAMTKNRALIGSRYIELFRTPFSEVEQVVIYTS